MWQSAAVLIYVKNFANPTRRRQPCRLIDSESERSKCGSPRRSLRSAKRLPVRLELQDLFRCKPAGVFVDRETTPVQATCCRQIPNHKTPSKLQSHRLPHSPCGRGLPTISVVCEKHPELRPGDTLVHPGFKRGFGRNRNIHPYTRSCVKRIDAEN